MLSVLHINIPGRTFLSLLLILVFKFVISLIIVIVKINSYY